MRYLFRVEGIMPERALLRLKREGISLYNVKKIEKNTLLFQVKKKDISKVFAIYPNLCYNNSVYSAYRVKSLGGVGIAKWLDFCKNRVGLLLGGLVFCIVTLSADRLVFGVDVVGATVYQREVLQALEENGVKPFALYPEGKEDLVTAKLLALRGVEFCSVQKIGNRVRVEVRSNPFSEEVLQKGSMVATRSGTLCALTVLRGAPLKKVGERIEAGEPLVGDWFETQEGGQVRVEIIARAQIACAYENTIDAESAEEAFATAYLELRLSDKDYITEREIFPCEEGFHVKINYSVIQTINF